MSASKIIRELYWIGIVLFASYLVISLNSSFNLMDTFTICPGNKVSMKNILVILQLAALLIFVRYMFGMTARMENEKIKFFLYPIILFALPVSLIMVWLQFLGC